MCSNEEEDTEGGPLRAPFVTPPTTTEATNVGRFGALGDGSDATAATREALAHLLRQGGGVLYFPPGKYLLREPIQIALEGETAVAIRGEGQNLSKLVWTCPAGGIQAKLPATGGFDGDKGAFVVQGLTLQSSCPAGAGTAIRVQTKASSPTPTKLLRDLILAPTDGGAGWDCGIELVDCTFTTIENVAYQGPGTAVRFDGKHDPVDNYVSKLRVFGGKTGVEVLGTSEGIYLEQCTILFVDEGIHWETDGVEPLLSVHGCHISASRNCIYGSNLLQPIIQGNLLYQCGDSDWVGIALVYPAPCETDLLQVFNNTIHGFGSSAVPPPAQNGIVIDGATAGMIHGNLIHHVDTGVWIRSAAPGLSVKDNHVQNFRCQATKEADEEKGR